MYVTLLILMMLFSAMIGFILFGMLIKQALDRGYITIITNTGINVLDDKEKWIKEE